MNYFNESNKNEAREYLKERRIASNGVGLLKEYNNRIPEEFKITEQPLLDVANYYKSEELKGNPIV